MTAIRGAAAAITGAASGIGRALALELAARGCDLALADRDEGGLQAVAAEIAKAGATKVTTHRVDVSEAQAIQDFAAAAVAAHPGLNIVVNNAGVALMGSFNEIDQAQMDWLMNINFQQYVMVPSRGHNNVITDKIQIEHRSNYCIGKCGGFEILD